MIRSAPGRRRLPALHFAAAAILGLPILCPAQSYNIATVAGDGVLGYSGDNGPALQAELWAFSGMAVDGSGNIFIADTGNCRIRKVSNGVITTVAGNGTCDFAGDGGPATAAELNFPRGVAADPAGNIYIADSNNARIRKVGLDGTIATIAGDGNLSFSGDGGPAIYAEMQDPWGIVADAAGNVYFVDRGNERIRKIGADGNINTVAGNGMAGYSGDGGLATAAALYTPVGVTLDLAGNLYIAESQSCTIRKVNAAGIIQTVAGTGTFGFSGDGGLAVSAQLNDPEGVAVDPAGNLFIADEDNQRIREVTPDGIIQTVAGDGTAAFRGDGGVSTNAELHLPEGMASSAGGAIYFVDSGNHRVRALSPPVVTTQYTLTVSAMPAAGGAVTPPSGGSYNAGTVVEITAAANPGYQFSGWTGSVANPAANPTIVTMNAAETVAANFTAGQASPAVTVFSPGQGAGSVAASATLNWMAPAGATSYEVYFGTSSPPPLAANITGTSYSPIMAAGVTYYWMVSARNVFGSTPSAVWSFTTAAGLRFVPVTPCRVLDTRTVTGGTIAAGGTLNVPIPQSACNIPSTAQAYSLNVTVVPPGPLTYLSIWPAGSPQPVVSTLNSFDGRIVANAAIVPAGASGAISLFASNATDAIIDINGYFVPAAAANSLSFYPATPCRVADTRNANGAFGGPFMSAGSTRSFAIPSSACGIPAAAQAYSLNITVVPHGALGYLTTWPSGQPQPVVSTLNSLNGAVVANAAIVPAGTSGGVNVFVTDDTDVIIDIDGYFAPPGGANALSLYTVTPCRVVDTRGAAGAFGGPILAANATRSFAIPSSACNVPSAAQAYSFNVTVVPPGPLIYLTAWPAGQTQPVVSTLNSFNGAVVANAAIVPAGASGGVSVFVSNATDAILDINAYFAQ